MSSQAAVVDDLGPEEPDFPDRPDQKITVYLETEQGPQPHKLRPGIWLVSKLKKKLGVDPTETLEQVTPNGLEPLKDDQRIRIHDGERFMAHNRTGASS